MSLILHPKLGINPHLTYCPRCGGESNELILLGNMDWIGQCPNCDLIVIGGGACPDCKPKRLTTRVRKIEEQERLPACEPCQPCRDEMAEHKAVVEAGGVYFKCRGCGARGVLKAGEFAASVRQATKIEAPLPVGIDLNSCPRCFPHGLDPKA